MRVLQDALVVRRYDRAKYPSSGLGGGSDGRASRFVLVDADGTETELPAAGRWELKAGQGFYLDKAGGGGYGDPKKRDRMAIARDLEEGAVTEDASRKDYGA